MSLHPEHLNDLRNSGLTDETIHKAGLKTIRPADISKVMGVNIQAVTSALSFPYPGTDHVRLKLFPPPAAGEDRPKYWQRQGTDVRLYIPVGLENQLKEVGTPLMITEGEKKALKAAQEGFCCVGVGGAWMFKEAGADALLDDLERIPKFERTVEIVYDSDFTRKEDVLLAVFRLGKLLEKRGAKVRVVCLPENITGKTGLDDYLATHSIEEFKALKRIDLNHEIFRANKCKEPKAERATAQPFQLDQILEGEILRPIRPGQDFIDGQMIFGVRAGKHRFFVRSDRMAIGWDQMQSLYEIRDLDFSRNGFSTEGLRRFLREQATVSAADLFQRLEDYYRRFTIFRSSETSVLLAIWTMGTYVHSVFRWFPYLWLTSPDKRCGKSTLMERICGVGFNSTGLTVNQSESWLFREVSANSATLLLDEVDNLRNADREHRGAIMSILNGGFNKDSVVNRSDTDGEKITPREFRVYSPKVLAGLEELSDTIADRCIKITLSRKKKTEKIERYDERKWLPLLARIKDDLHIFGLTYATEIAKFYNLPDLMDIPAEADDRCRDILEPLFAIAMIVDTDANDMKWTAVGGMKRVVMQQAEIRQTQEADTQAIPMLIRLLREQPLNGDSLYLKGKEFLGVVKESPGLESVDSPQKLGALMRKLNLRSAANRIPGETGVDRCYKVPQEVLQDLYDRYISDVESVTSVTSDGEQGKKASVTNSSVTEPISVMQEALFSTENGELVTVVTP